jgi:hypothetical protein
MNSAALGTTAQEILRNRREQPRSVAAEAVRVHSAAMREAFECREGAFDNVARACAAELGDKTHSASIMIGFRIAASIPHVT